MSTEKEIRPPEEDGREKQEISGSVLEAKRAIETIGAGALEEAARAIRSLEERAVNRELSPGNGFDGLTASKRGEILKKIVDKSIVFAQRLIKISALVALGLTANYFRTKESVSESSGTNNEIVYAHGDEETTHILNYLAGRETLAEEEQLRFLIMVAREFATVMVKPIPENMDAMSITDIKNYITQNLSAGGAELVPDRYAYSRAMYDTVWTLEREVGAPKIRWNTDVSRDPSNLTSSSYSVLTNTIYIRPTHPLMNLSRELAHSDQFRNRPVESYLIEAEGYLRIALKTITRLQSPGSARGEEYSVPGSIEHEAHQKIHPEIRRRLGLDESEEKTR